MTKLDFYSGMSMCKGLILPKSNSTKNSTSSKNTSKNNGSKSNGSNKKK